MLVSLSFLLLCATPTLVCAQKSPRGINTVELEKQIADAETAFMNTAADVALQYEEAGDLEKAQEILEKILRLQPDLSKVQAKIKELEEERLSKNEALLEIDPSKGWVSAGVGVKKGSKIRFESEGESRIIISQRVGSEGFPSGDVKQDLVAGVPLGALMGVVVTRKGKTSEPFLIGKKSEIEISQEGQLLVRVNVPPGSKCTGKIRLRITGEIQMGSQSNRGK